MLGHFGVTLVSLGRHFAHFGVTLGSLWVPEGCSGLTLVHFQETFIFQIDFNDLPKSGVNCGSLWVTLGSLLAYEDDFGAILRSLRHHFWHVKATLESLFAYDDDFVATLGSFCVHFWHVRAALGAFGRHFGATLGAPAAYENDFGATLGSFWGQSGVSLGICG